MSGGDAEQIVATAFRDEHEADAGVPSTATELGFIYRQEFGSTGGYLAHYDVLCTTEVERSRCDKLYSNC